MAVAVRPSSAPPSAARPCSSLEPARRSSSASSAKTTCPTGDRWPASASNGDSERRLTTAWYSPVMFGRWLAHRPESVSVPGAEQLLHAVHSELEHADSETVTVVAAIAGLLGAVA